MSRERQHRRTWTQQEDDNLRRAIAAIQPTSSRPPWKVIAAYMNKNNPDGIPRNAKQCRQRYVNAMAPNPKEERPWTQEDTIRLIRAIKQYGHRWARLVQILNSPVNDNRLKNHFYCELRKFVRHINNVVTNDKNQYLQKKKQKIEISEEEEAYGEKLLRLKVFQVKYMSKIFSICDTKTQFKYEIFQNLSLDDIKSVNHQIIDLMDHFVNGGRQFDKDHLLKILLDVLHINKVVKIKPIREPTVTLLTKEQIQKRYEKRQRKNKSMSKIIKKEYQYKILADKRARESVKKLVKVQNRRIRFAKSGRRLYKHYQIKAMRKERVFTRSQNAKEQIKNEAFKLDKIEEQAEQAEEVKIAKKQEASPEQRDIVRKPFQSSFLNDIPVAKPEDQAKNENQAHHQFRFPEPCGHPFPGFFGPPPPNNQPKEQEIQRSNPLMTSSMFTFDPELSRRYSIFHASMQQQMKRDSLFGSMGMQNHEKISEGSQKLKNSLFESHMPLHPFPPPHPNLFEEPKAKEEGNLDRSQAFSIMMYSGMLDAQGMNPEMYMSDEIRRRNQMWRMAQSYSFPHEIQPKKEEEP